ncbi:hypothetical protein ACFLRR_00380 [Bacteroidota bacterium]
MIKEFLWLVIFANIIAIPISIFIMNKWLENFAYKTNIGVIVFIGAALLSAAIVFLTLSFNAINAARRNPVDSLRHE